MTDKELHKLGRRELLQLMLVQGREAEKAKQELADTQDKLAQLEEGYERLKRRLNEKDVQIHKLRTSLQNVRESASRGNSLFPVAPAIPDPDDHYAPPVSTASSAAVEPPVAEKPAEASAAAPIPRQEKHSDYDPVANDVTPTVKPANREQYYDYLFGPVVEQAQEPSREQEQPASQAPPQAVLPPQEERKPVPVPAPQAAYPAQPYMVAQSENGYIQPWPEQVYAVSGPPSGIYLQAAHYAPRYPQPYEPKQRYLAGYPYEQHAGYYPQPWSPQDSPEEFIPESEQGGSEGEGMQALNAVEFVDGRAVSQSPVLRPKR